jgi:hypothetical protein
MTMDLLTGFISVRARFFLRLALIVILPTKRKHVFST